mmetsp:Transcript_1878/g.7821  ORF Transcript_1878/g.7821 Transcript_1878/m.7821 type:complete len:213 (+) Transcript_1878:157-795(+)
MALMVFWRSTTPRRTSARLDDVANATRSEAIFLSASASFASRLLFVSLGVRISPSASARRTRSSAISASKTSSFSMPRFSERTSVTGPPGTNPPASPRLASASSSAVAASSAVCSAAIFASRRADEAAIFFGDPTPRWCAFSFTSPSTRVGAFRTEHMRSPNRSEHAVSSKCWGSPATLITTDVTDPPPKASRRSIVNAASRYGTCLCWVGG